MPPRSRRPFHYLYLSWEEWEAAEYAARPAARHPERSSPPPPAKPVNPLAAHVRSFTYAQRRGWVTRLRAAGITQRTFNTDAAGSPDLALVPLGRLLAYRAWLLAWNYPDLLVTVETGPSASAPDQWPIAGSALEPGVAPLPAELRPTEVPTLAPYPTAAMATLPALPVPTATRLTYAAATAAQREEAQQVLRRELAAALPRLSGPAAAQALAEHDCPLWVTTDGRIELAYADSIDLLLALLDSAPPDLDAVHAAYVTRAAYLARRLHLFSRQAVQALAEVEADPTGVGPLVFELLTALAKGNATAAQVIAARGMPPGSPVATATDPLPGSPAVLARLQALRRRRRGSEAPTTAPQAA